MDHSQALAPSSQSDGGTDELCPLKVSARDSGSTHKNVRSIPGKNDHKSSPFSPVAARMEFSKALPSALDPRAWLPLPAGYPTLYLADTGMLSQGPAAGHRGISAQWVPPGCPETQFPLLIGVMMTMMDDIDINNSSSI